MNKRLLAVLVFALLVAGVATGIVYRLLSGTLASSAKTDSKRILVAAHDLKIGTLIKSTDLKEADWNGPIPANAVSKSEDVVDRGVIADIYDGEPVLANRLAQKGAGAGMAATIPVGMRAAAVRVNEVVGVAGFVTPGQRVDVLILGSPQGRNQQGTMSRTLLQNIEVLSAGQQIQKDSEGKPVTVPVVNLLVTPEQAEILSLASNDARIQLVLRNPLDTKETKTPGTEMDKLFAASSTSAVVAPKQTVRRAAPVKAAAPPVKVEPPPLVVEIIISGKSGVKKTEQKFMEKPEAN